MGIVSFLRRKVGKSREFRGRFRAAPSAQPPNNFNFHARFAGCGPIVAFPPRIERCFRVKKWPRISRRKGKWREKGKLFRYSFFLFVFVLYSYFYSNFQCDFILSINFVRFLMSFFKSDRGFCERILEK